MQVSPNRVVTIRATVSFDGQAQPSKTFTFVYGMDRLMFDLDRRLYGLSPDQTATVELKPFGDPHPELVRQLPVADLIDPPDFVPGNWYECRTVGGEPAAFRFLKRDGDLLTCDFNHPNAGKAMTISASILDVREATFEELAEARRCSSSG